MTLRIDRIEIRQQPERKRYWAEAEVFAPRGFSRNVIVTPEADGRAGIVAAILAWCDELDPPPRDAEPRLEVEMPAFTVDRPMFRTMTQPEAERILEGAAEIERASSNRWPDVLPALRAEAAALGVAVDNRWGEVRLRQEIASVGQRESAGD